MNQRKKIPAKGMRPIAKVTHPALSASHRPPLSLLTSATDNLRMITLTENNMANSKPATAAERGLLTTNLSSARKRPGASEAIPPSVRSPPATTQAVIVVQCLRFR